MSSRIFFEGFSDSLHHAMNGDMKEGLQQTGEMEDIEWEVFVGLCEYAYTKDYLNSLPMQDGLPEKRRDFKANTFYLR